MRRESGAQAGIFVHSNFEPGSRRSEEHTSELQSQSNLVCRLLLEKTIADILGISASYHQSATGLLRHREIVAAAPAERFHRSKQYCSFPTESVRSCPLARAVLLSH